MNFSDAESHVGEQSMSTTGSFEGESASGLGVQTLYSLMPPSLLKYDLTESEREGERYSRRGNGGVC